MKPLTKQLKIFWWRIKSFFARYYYGNPSNKLKIVGVTGTNGKTTITTLLYKIATELGYKAGLVGTVDNIIAGKVIHTDFTTPEPSQLNRFLFEMAKERCEYVFMEVTSHGLEEKRVAGLKFTGAVFTNLTHDHLDYHGNMENYFSAKKKLFDMLSENSFALSNIDDQYGLKIMEGTKAKKYTYGFKHRADFGDKLKTKLLGDFNAYNALAVWSVCQLLGFDMSKVNKILENIEPPRGRLENFISPNGILVIVDYAHTPDALQNVLQTVKDMKKENTSPRPNGRGKIISVFGCGGDRDPLKRSVMGKIGTNLSDIAIFTSDNPRSENPDAIIQSMKKDLTKEELKKVITMSDRRLAISEAVKLARKGDIILCAGKGHEDYQEIKGMKTHFNDLEEFKKIFSL